MIGIPLGTQLTAADVATPSCLAKDQSTIFWVRRFSPLRNPSLKSLASASCITEAYKSFRELRCAFRQIRFIRCVDVQGYSFYQSMRESEFSGDRAEVLCQS